LFIHSTGSQEQCSAVDEEVNRRVIDAKYEVTNAQMKLERLNQLQARIGRA
jgi:hypothetical protein